MRCILHKKGPNICTAPLILLMPDLFNGRYEIRKLYHEGLTSWVEARDVGHSTAQNAPLAQIAGHRPVRLSGRFGLQPANYVDADRRTTDLRRHESDPNIEAR